MKSYKFSCFLSGLWEDIRFMVRMLNLVNLPMIFSLAKMQEENVVALKRTARLGSIPSQGTNRSMNTLEKRVVLPIQRLTHGQMKEQREKGLCYNCDDKWGHLTYDTRERLKVKVTNGQTMDCEGRTAVVPLHMQSYNYIIDFFLF